MAQTLKDVFPEFANELRTLLSDETDLAATVDDLELVDRCRCGDSFCSSIYTVTPPQGAWGIGHENIMLDAEKGMIILDVVNRKIGMIEVLNRDDVQKRIVELIP